MHLEYYDQWADCMEDYLNGVNEDLWCPIIGGPFSATAIEFVGSAAQNYKMIVTRLKKKENDKMCIRELRGALPPVIYNYIQGYKMA